MNHGAAQFFSGGPTAGPAQSDFVGGAVVLGYDGVVDGDVCCALLKIAHGIAAGGHNVAEELIRFSDSSGGGVNEVSLNATPLLDITGALTRS